MCTVGDFESVPCSQESNRECETCAVCNENQQLAQVCTTISDAVCGT